MVEKLLDIHDIMEIFKVSRCTIYQWIKNRSFPSPQKYGNFSRWTEKTVREYIEEKTQLKKDKE